MGLGPRGGGREGAWALQRPPQPLQHPLRWRRRWDRGTLLRLPTPLEGVAASATQDSARTAQRGRDRRRGYAPHRARPGPRRVAPEGMRWDEPLARDDPLKGYIW